MVEGEGREDTGFVPPTIEELDEILAAMRGIHGNGWINITVRERRVFAHLLEERIAVMEKEVAG